GVEPEDEDEDQGSHAAPEAEPDSSRADAERDEPDDDEPLDRDQDPVHRAHQTSSSFLRSCWHVLESRSAAASAGSDAAMSANVFTPEVRVVPIAPAAVVTCVIASSSVSASSSSESCACSRSSFDEFAQSDILVAAS